MSDVFISYSKHDRDIAQALADDLRRKGFNVWWDFELYAGEDFHEVILTELDAARAVVVIWSATAAKSPWVRDEANRAAKRGKLVTTHVADFDLTHIPLGFGQRQCEPVAQRDKIIRALGRLNITPTVPAAALVINITDPATWNKLPPDAHCPCASGKTLKACHGLTTIPMSVSDLRSELIGGIEVLSEGYPLLQEQLDEILIQILLYLDSANLKSAQLEKAKLYRLLQLLNLDPELEGLGKDVLSDIVEVLAHQIA